MEGQLNYTYICLIPKEDDACSVDKFRPISLCNFAYKIISKIVATRLRAVIDKLVCPLQSAFVPGRWIAESSILTQELIHTIKRKKGKGGLMAIKLDMLKAYDRLEWNFLREVLRGSDFDDQVCALIMECVTTVSYSVLLNGVPQKKFFPKRGLRQGDPLSTFLLLMCHNILSKLLLREQVEGISISRNAPAISHLMFADDTILFTRANMNIVSSILQCISKYESWSGQKCSLAKSSVLFSGNMGGSQKSNILKYLNVKECSGQERHLGNPFVFKRRKREEYKYLKEKVLKRIEGCKTKLLSFAGRTTLVKSVALSIPLYAMSTNKIPVSTCREIDSIIRRFWWIGGSEKERFMALISWDCLCRPLLVGGLGFRKIEDMNKALLAKLAWQLAANVYRPWVKCLAAKYCRTNSIWSAETKNNDSALWKGILSSRDILYKGGMSIARRGDLIDIWRQPWILWLEYREFREIMDQARLRYPQPKSIADVSNDDGSWNAALIHDIFGGSLGDRICKIARMPLGNNDMLVWKEAGDSRPFMRQGLTRTTAYGS
uniref:Reverse transcriptase domain-containing protein n=1 Tax=Cannabis sativa TaxID=3483 RepID=A0A803Q0W1_CANSA